MITWIKKADNEVLLTCTMVQQSRCRLKFFAVNLLIIVFVCQVECFYCRFGICLSMCKLSELVEGQSAIAIQVVVVKSVGEGLIRVLVINRALSPSTPYAINHSATIENWTSQIATIFATAFHFCCTRPKESQNGAKCESTFERVWHF